jgi:nitrate/TMAO reductase-like tetraheme cytochrome c subunit
MSDPEAAGGQQPEPAQETDEGTGEPPVADEPSEGRRRKHPFYLRGRHIRLPRSRAGLVALMLVLAAGGSIIAFTSVTMIQWTESADFCGRCHTMAPELEAHAAGPHREVSCGECHVEPGITGWIKAKINGTRQLVDVVMGTYPTPILPPAHSELPSTADTCQKCHSLDDRSFASLRTETVFQEDEPNTRDFVGLMIRPGGGNPFDVNRSVHWHVLSKFSYLTPDENASAIDYVTATRDDGSVVEFIAASKVRAEDVQTDIDNLKATERNVTLSCYDCHNRVGHDVLNPRDALNFDLSQGTVDTTLPYIKREGMRLLWSQYPDEAAANADIEKLADFYRTNYPDVFATKGAQIAAAISQIKLLYSQSATPDMKVTASTYANNLGHTDFPGCFRCHDGGHFQVVDGVATKTPIPSTCNTCHTFPQIGPTIASVPLGPPPGSHSDTLWVFDHKDSAISVDPSGQVCASCHARDYCVNCHSTGAVTVDHETMTTNHAQVVRDQGNTACAYCHLPVFCARCHKEPVLPVTTPFSHGPTADTEPPLGYLTLNTMTTPAGAPPGD